MPSSIDDGGTADDSTVHWAGGDEPTSALNVVNRVVAVDVAVRVGSEAIDAIW